MEAKYFILKIVHYIAGTVPNLLQSFWKSVLNEGAIIDIITAPAA
jgi:hypothetical protein